MAQTERTAIQSDLAWVGVYNGAITGEVNERMINAIKAYQKDHGAKQTGVLNPQERATLAAAAKKLQNDVGWKIASDPINGIRLGVPTKLVPQMSSMAEHHRIEMVVRAGPDPDRDLAAARRRSYRCNGGRAREEGARRPQGRLQRGAPRLLRAVRTAGPEEILRSRPDQRQRSSRA